MLSFIKFIESKLPIEKQYKILSDLEFNNFRLNHIPVNFNINEILRLESLADELTSPIGYSFYIKQNSDNPSIIEIRKKSFDKTYNGYGYDNPYSVGHSISKYNIIKFFDDWYLCNSHNKSGSSSYILCDDFKGLINYIKDDRNKKF